MLGHMHKCQSIQMVRVIVVRSAEGARRRVHLQLAARRGRGVELLLEMHRLLLRPLNLALQIPLARAVTQNPIRGVRAGRQELRTGGPDRGSKLGV